MKRRRRRDILRVQLVRIFELLADAGVVSQMYVIHDKYNMNFYFSYIWLLTIIIFLVLLFLQSQRRVRWREPLSEQHAARVC